MSEIFNRIRQKGYNVNFTYHADAILYHDFREAVEELDKIVSDISVPIIEIIRGGGGEAQVTQRLRNTLYKNDWNKRIFNVEKKIDNTTTRSQSHEVDHIKSFPKGTIALEIEWNNKDPFFDRDLENFNRLHSDGGISIGIIVTRGQSLQDGIEWRIRDFALSHNISSFSDLDQFDIAPTKRQRHEVERFIASNNCNFAHAWATCFTRDKFGTATTHWSKLKARLDRGVGSPCPSVAVGIPLSCVQDPIKTDGAAED